jgi:hypothetical protein
LLPIPGLVEAIDGSALELSGIWEVSLTEDRLHVRIAADCLLRSDVISVAFYFGRDSGVVVPRYM